MSQLANSGVVPCICGHMEGMQLDWRTLLIFCLPVILIGPMKSWAEDVEIPEEELARESVLPVFDKKIAVKARNVSTEGKVEVAAVGGMSVGEPFFDQIVYGGILTYHFTDISGIQLLAAMINSTSSQYVGQLDDPRVVSPPMRYGLLPQPKYIAMGAYEWAPFYGKISITKSFVMNLTTYTTLGLGIMGLGDTTTYLGAIGVGQNYFFGPSWGIKLDLRGILYQGINPNSVDHNGRTSTPPVSAYEKQLSFDISLLAGLVFLL